MAVLALRSTNQGGALVGYSTRRTSTRTRFRIRVAALAAAVVAVSTGISLATSAQAGPSHPYVRVCATPTKAGEMACLSYRRTDIKAQAIAPNATPSGFGPTSLRAAYALTATGSSSQTVAIVDAYDDPNAESDLAAYRTQYGLAACTTANGCFSKIDQNGGTNYPAADAGWAGEISL